MVVAGAVLAILAGCAPSANVPPAGGQFDGVYAGETTLVGGFGYVCGAPSYSVSIPIKDGRFSYMVPISPSTTPLVSVQIRADGSLAGQVLYMAESFWPRGPDFIPAWLTIAGHIAGAELDATVRDYRCVRHMVLRRG